MLDALQPADDLPMTLQQACDTVFGGAITPATLRVEHGRGRLVIIKVGRKQFVTHGGIKDMLNKCQLDPQERDPGSISSRSGRTEMAASRGPGGSSATEASSAAQDALQVTLQALKKH